jgi:uncharacterized protein DUF2510
MAGSGRGESSRPPGWYADPDRAETIRYWSGSGWTDRRRPRPAWSKKGSGALQIASPAPTAEISAAREATASHASAEVMPLSQPVPPPDLGGPPEAPPSPRGGGDGEGEPGRARSRRKWWLIATVAVLAAVAVVVTGEAIRPKSHGPRVLTDARFVQLANAECAKTLPDLRPPNIGPFGSNITPVQAADGIDHAAGGLDALAERLRILPASDLDRPHINGWLDGWHRYTALGRQYASFLRQNGTKNPGHLLAGGVKEAHLADDFALANGLKSCTFSYTPQPDPSNGF